VANSRDVPQTSSPWCWVADHTYELRTRSDSAHGPWTLARDDGGWALTGEGFEDPWELGPVSTSVAHWEAFARVCTYLAATADVDPLCIIQLAEPRSGAEAPTPASDRGPMCDA
jgi:hypothetical protein